MLVIQVMDGITASSHIRILEAQHGVSKVKSLPIIAVTAHDENTYRPRCLRVGMQVYYYLLVHATLISPQNYCYALDLG